MSRKSQATRGIIVRGRRGFERLEERALLSVAPAGPAFAVPTTAVANDQEMSDVAIAASGDFVVVWQHEVTSTNHDIRFRRYNADGTPKDGIDLPVANSGLDELAPRVGMADNGDFVVVWQTEVTTGNFDVFYRRFNASGVALDPASVNVDTDSDSQITPDVYVHGTGNFEIVWDDRPFAGGNGIIRFRRFTAGGAALDPDEISVANTGEDESQPRISGGRQGVAIGNYVIAWTGQTVAEQDVLFRLFNSNGTPLSDATLVDLDQTTNQHDPSVAMDPFGAFVVTYAHEPSAGDVDIYLRRFSGTSFPLGDRQPVDTTGVVVTDSPDVGVASAGNMVVVYENVTANDVQYRQFNTDGTPRGDARSPGSSPAASPDAPAVAMNAAGEFVLSWEQGAANRDILARNWRRLSATPGLYDPAAGAFFLRNSNTAGPGELNFFYGPAGVTREPIVGDWNGDGLQTIGLYDPVNAVMLLRNSNNAGVADNVFAYGPPGAGWRAIAGDWDGDGVDTIGLYDPNTGRFFLRNSNTAGTANLTFQYGAGGAIYSPLAGDWDGDGIDTVGLFHSSSSTFLLRNSNTAGAANIIYQYGPSGSSFRPLAGDWNRDGIDTAGLYNPAAGEFLLRNTHAGGIANVRFRYGAAGALLTPVVGDWNGPGGAPLLFDGVSVDVGIPAAPLADVQLQPVVDEALARWAFAGLDSSMRGALSGADVQIADLPGNYLGLTWGGAIYVDRDAAGQGWFVDHTADEDEEFDLSGDRLLARSDSAARGRVDLLTVVTHELGHLLGLGDLDGDHADLMNGRIGTGIRNLPMPGVVDQIFGG